MQGTISGENAFKCIKSTFAIGPTTNGYNLNYSVDKVNWTSWQDDTPANETLIVNGATPLMWFRLEGNTDENVQAIF